MAVGALVLGIINIVIVVAVLIVVGLVVIWGASILKLEAPPPQLQKAYMVVVGAVAIYMLVALLLGLPSIVVLRG